MSHAAAVDEALAGPAPASRNGRATVSHLHAETSEPVFTAEVDSYRIEWSAPPVTICLDLVRGDRRSGEVQAELEVSAAGTRLIQAVRTNLGAATTRAQLAKHAAERAQGVADGRWWAAAVDEACARTIRAFRAGDPPVLLRDAQPPAKASWAVEPLVLAQHPVMLFGDGGTMKSYIALALGLTLHTGTSVLGLAPAARMRVGFADWEFTDWDHKERMLRLLGAGAELPDLVYVRCENPLRDEAPRLQRIIRDHRLEVMIFDSAGFACEGPPEEAQSALGFWRAFRSLRVGGIITAHDNRSHDSERPFGSTFWHNGARATWYVKKQQDLGAAGLSVGLFNKKANLTGLSRPLGFRFEFDGDRTRIVRSDVRDVPELAGQVPLKDRMTHALEAGTLTYAELADVLEVDGETVARVAIRYKDRLFTVLPGVDGKKRVGLAQHESDTVRSDTPDTVRDSVGDRTDTPSLSKRRVSGPLSAPQRFKAPTNRCSCGELDWNAADDDGWRCGGCSRVVTQ
jgi:hypothetical protein